MADFRDVSFESYLVTFPRPGIDTLTAGNIPHRKQAHVPPSAPKCYCGCPSNDKDSMV